MKLCVLATALASVPATLADGTCRLTQSLSDKPSPSLKQCFQFNALSCCVSGHDSEITAALESALTPSCINEYPALTGFFCLGCDPEQPLFVDSTGASPVLRVCESFADTLFNLDLDRCGINLNVVNPLANESHPAAAWEVGHYERSATKQVVLPSQVFGSAESFLQEIKPPFFEQYDIVVVPASEDEEELTCFSSALRAARASGVLFISTALLALFVLPSSA